MPRPLAPDATLALKAAAEMDFKLADPDKKKFAGMAVELTALLGPMTVLQEDASDQRACRRSRWPPGERKKGLHDHLRRDRLHP